MKYKKIAILSLCILGFGLVAEAQYYRYGNPWYRYGPSGMLMNNYVTYSTRGTNMMNREYMLGRIEFTGKLPPLEGYYMNYDLERNQIELKTDGNDVQKIDLKLIKSFELYNEITKEIRHFENGYNYQFDGVPLVGIYEVLSEGKTPLFARWTADVSTSNSSSYYDYNVRVQKNIKIVQEFYAVDGKNVLLLDKNLKKNEHIFGDKLRDIELMMKEKKLKLKNRQDVIRIFEYYNTLL
ncbi:hypothetical protein R9C00_08785 [Flammeovirgaceae bacterium SG7u.111]|nr:hypothetical protein [Flammeovirgaceae bacterium SG7u.132]WPO37543.1 hypothetical protein R9C00_08785 [Flammeovirgaceae bacterium SG7u.111]